jgi:hypothetical protein
MHSNMSKDSKLRGQLNYKMWKFKISNVFQTNELMNIIEHEIKGIGTWKEKEDELFIELEHRILFFGL